MMSAFPESGRPGYDRAIDRFRRIAAVGSLGYAQG